MSERVTDGPPVPEAPLAQTDAGLVAAGHGWFVMNARDARWIERPGCGFNLPFTGWTEEEAETYFTQLGVALIRLPPGEPIGVYHWEADAEDFLMLTGEGVLVIEGEERPLHQWDFVHCPPGTRHMIAGAGEDGCLLIAMSSREHLEEDCAGGAYVTDEAAAKYGASALDPEDPYGQFPERKPTRYQDGWLPFGS